MALETLKGFDPGEFITIDHETNTIAFKIQAGPINVNGLNGCQVDDMIVVVARILEGLNDKRPSRYNETALDGLHQAMVALVHRTKDRTLRGVEGTDKP